MKKPLRVLFALIYLVISIPLAYAQAEAYALTRAQGKMEHPLSRVVTASDYAVFLNAVPASDADDLYNQQMASDSSTACIVRVGTPGQWYYEVIEGRENVPAKYVSSYNEVSYSSWLQESLQVTGDMLQKDDATINPLLKSNVSCFAIDIASSPMLALATAAPSSISNLNSYLEEASEVAAFIALAGFGSVGMMEEGHNAILEPRSITPLKTRKNPLSLEESPEVSQKSSDDSDGYTSKERASSGDILKGVHDSTTTASKKKVVTFAGEVMPSLYAANAADARRLGNRKLANLWDQASSYALQSQDLILRRTAFHHSEGYHELVLDLFEKASSYANGLIEAYAAAAADLNIGKEDLAVHLKGRSASAKEILDHHVRASK